MRKMDEEDVAVAITAPKALRRYLLERVQSSPAVRRLTAHPVHAFIQMKPLSESRLRYDISEDNSEKFFVNWTAATEALHSCQRERTTSWDMERRPTPILVEWIEMDLSSVPLTDRVVEAIVAMASKGIAVSATTVCLDIRLVTFDDVQLTTFLNTVTKTTQGPVSVNMAQPVTKAMTVVDAEGANYADYILMILRCIGQLECEVEVELGNMLLAFNMGWNLLKLTRGIFEYLLSRSFPTSIAFFETHGTAHGTNLVEAEVRRWREAHPHVKLRLKSLPWSPDAFGIGFVRGLLRALDDIEEVSLYPEDGGFTVEDLQIVLQYPSLRKLHIGPVDVPTMEIFDISTDSETKTALEVLELSGLTLGDPTSMVSFIKRLDPSSEKPSALSRTLRTFGLAETNESVRGPERGDNYTRRAINDAAAVAAIEDVLATNKVLQHVTFIGTSPTFPSFYAVVHSQHLRERVTSRLQKANVEAKL